MVKCDRSRENIGDGDRICGIRECDRVCNGCECDRAGGIGECDRFWGWMLVRKCLGMDVSAIVIE